MIAKSAAVIMTCVSLICLGYFQYNDHSDNAISEVPYKWPKPYNNTFVGILTQPAYGFGLNLTNSKYYSGALSYTNYGNHKYIEQTGATSLVIPWDLPWPQMEYLLDHTHGILLPGGDIDNFIEKGNLYGEKILTT